MSSKTVKIDALSMAILSMLYEWAGELPIRVQQIEEKLVPNDAMHRVEEMLQAGHIVKGRHPKNGEEMSHSLVITDTGENIVRSQQERVVAEARAERDKLAKSQRGASEVTKERYAHLRACCAVFLELGIMTASGKQDEAEEPNDD